MKKGYKHMTGVFGEDAELYLSKLFKMMRNPRGKRRPDLISINNEFNPRLSLEVKSGIDGKVSLVAYQLHYGITSDQDYRELFGDPLPENGVLPGLENKHSGRASNERRIAYYYDIISRDKGVISEDLDRPFAQLKLSWGNQAIVPHDLVFYGFAGARHLRTSEKVEDIIQELQERMKLDVDEQSSHYQISKEKQDWQNFYLRDMMAIHQKNDDLATSGGKERIRLMRENYPDFDNLERIVLPGPNGTQIYVLSLPQDLDLFDTQLRQTVEERNPILQRILNSRKRSLELVDKIDPFPDKELFSQERENEYQGLTQPERKRLKRLAHWADRNEPLEVLPSEEIQERQAMMAEYNGEFADVSQVEELDGIPI